MKGDESGVSPVFAEAGLDARLFYIIFYCMSVDSNIREILDTSEKALLDAMAGAAQNGDLDAVDRTRWVVGQIRQIADGLKISSVQPAAKSRSKETEVQKKQGRRNVRNAEYPLFAVRNGTLYRTAWSRKKRSEYEHKVPKAITETITRAMSTIASADGRPATVEDIVAKINRSSAVQIPQYQIYLVVGWLRHANCIEQVGRDGYRIPTDISEVATQYWQKLSSQNK